MKPLDRIASIPQAAIDGLTKIITHAGCPDGIASAILLHEAFPALPIEFVYHGTPEHAQAPCAALFCDFAPPFYKAEDWRDAGAIVLDHHATAQPIVSLFGERGVFAHEKDDPGDSGAWLAFLMAARRGAWGAQVVDFRDTGGECVIAAPGDALRAAQFAQLVGVRDTWQRADKDWETACALASALTFYGPDHWLDVKRLPTDDEVAAGRIIYERRIAKAASLAETLSTVGEFGGLNFVLFNDSLDKLTSDVGEAARAAGRDVDFVAGFFYTDAGHLVFSLRSVADGFDVGRIAKANGGGGHTRAAGFQCNWGYVDAPIDALRRALSRVQ